MKWILAAWLTIWSIAWQVKSENWISTIGRDADQRSADGGADDAELGDRGVADALLAEAVDEVAGDAERAAVHADVLAEQEHPTRRRSSPPRSPRGSPRRT